MKLPKPVIGHERSKEPEVALPPSGHLTIAKDKKGLAIALIASFVFLLGAAGVSAWLFMQKSGADTVVNQLDPNSTVTVKTVSWVAPTMPAGFTAIGQSTHDADVVYYPNESTGCAITTGVTDSTDESEQAQIAASTGDDTNVSAKTVAAAASQDVTINDTDGQRTYDFKTASFNHQSSSPTASEKQQVGVAYYKQFGHNLAVIRYVCKSSVAAANGSSLEELITKFTVTTER